MSKLKNILYLSIYEAILGISIYLQYGNMLDKINNKTYEFVLFFVFFLCLSASSFIITNILAQRKKFEIDMMYICVLIMGFLIYIILICNGVYSILEYSKNDKILKIAITVLCNISTTVMVYRYNKRRAI